MNPANTSSKSSLYFLVAQNATDCFQKLASFIRLGIHPPMGFETRFHLSDGSEVHRGAFHLKLQASNQARSGYEQAPYLLQRRLPFRCIRWRPQLSGAEPPIDRSIARPLGGGKEPGVKTMLVPAEKLSRSSNDSLSIEDYSFTTPLFRRSDPTGRVRPSSSI